ncbi:MAG: hypothetical protein NNA30_09550 [Nitrospira sp.]|nr:hypothetical protein [Nitrospira sp.]
MKQQYVVGLVLWLAIYGTIAEAADEQCSLPLAQSCQYPRRRSLRCLRFLSLLPYRRIRFPFVSLSFVEAWLPFV